MKTILGKLGFVLPFLLITTALATPDFQLANGTNGLSFVLQSATNHVYLIQSVDHLDAEGWVTTSNSVYHRSNNWQPDRLLQTGTNGHGETAFTVPNQGSGFYRATAFTGAVDRVTFAPAVTPVKLLDPLNYTWIFTNTTPGLEQLIRLRAPGAHPTNAVILGSSPPGTDLFYLRADGAWQTNEVIYTNAGFGGTIGGQPPLYREGLWQFEFILRDPVSGDIVEYNTKAFLVGSSPRIFLHVSRPIANGDDPVKASVDMASGFSTANVKLLAWLAQPDGSTVSLPWFLPGLDSAYTGVVTNQTIDLFHRAFPTNGQYRVEARLMDADSGATLGVGSVPFSVCDSSVTVSGQLQDANGVALTNTADLSRVRALDIDDLSTITTNLDSTGNYSLALPAGRYLLGATFWNSTGFYESFTNLTYLVVDCGSTNPVINLALLQLATNGIPATPHLSMANAKGGGQFQSLSSPASDTCRKPVIYVLKPTKSSLISASPEAIRAAGWAMAARLEATGDFEVKNQFLLADMIEALRQQQLHGTDEGVTAADVQAIENYVDTEFLATLNFSKTPSIPLFITASVFPSGTLLPVAQQFNGDFIAADSVSAGYVTDLLVRGGTAGGNPHTLLAACRATQGVVFPTNSLALSKDTVVLNEPITITSSVSDTCGGAPVAGSEVIFSALNATLGGETVLATLTTGNDGKASTQFTPTTYGLFKIKADFHRLVSPTAALRVWDTNGIQMTSSKVHLSYGESAVIAVHLPTLKNAPANQPPPVKLQETFSATQPLTQLYVTNIAASSIYVSNAPDGSLYVTPTNVVDFAISYTAPNQAGLAELTAARRDAGNSGTNNSSGLINFIVDSGVETSLTATPKSVFGGYPSKLTLDALINGVRLAGLPVTYTLTGSGTLETNATATDEYGLATVYYTAPTNVTGSATITTTLAANGLLTTNTVTVSYSPLITCGSTNVYCLQEIFVSSNANDNTFPYNAPNARISDAGVLIDEKIYTQNQPPYAHNITQYFYHNGALTTLFSFTNTLLSFDAQDMNNNGDILEELHSPYPDINTHFVFSGGVSNALPANFLAGTVLDDGSIFGGEVVANQFQIGRLLNGVFHPLNYDVNSFHGNHAGYVAYNTSKIIETFTFIDADGHPQPGAGIEFYLSEARIPAAGTLVTPAFQTGYNFFGGPDNTRPTPNYFSSFMADNDAGDVLLKRFNVNDSDHPIKITLVKKSGEIQDVPHPPGFNTDFFVYGFSINGLMLSYNSNGEIVIYKKGQWQVLSTLVNDTLGWHFDNAQINNRGEILVFASKGLFNGILLLTPTGK